MATNHEPTGSTPLIVSVTPELAGQFLSHNTQNRHIRPTRVAQYARDMAEGRWTFNGDPIRFSDVGGLLDGQHRLAAIIESDTTQPFVVIKGLLAASQETMDQALGRTPADALTMRGYTNASDLAAAARRVLVYDRTNAKRVRESGAGLPTRMEVLEFIERTPELKEVIRRQCQGDRRLPNLKKSLSSALFYIFSRQSWEKAELFVEQLYSGANLSPNSPILALRNRLTQGPAQGTRWDDQTVAIWFVRAWNAWREGRPLAKVQATSDASLPPLTTSP
jgi:hypothetical protein